LGEPAFKLIENTFQSTITHSKPDRPDNILYKTLRLEELRVCFLATLESAPVIGKTSEPNDTYTENTTTYFVDKVMKTCDRRGHNRGIRL
jgi:hypothetical protein